MAFGQHAGFRLIQGHDVVSPTALAIGGKNAPNSLKNFEEALSA
jgi:hypothetical protein